MLGLNKGIYELAQIEAQGQFYSNFFSVCLSFLFLTQDLTLKDKPQSRQAVKVGHFPEGASIREEENRAL